MKRSAGKPGRRTHRADGHGSVRDAARWQSLLSDYQGARYKEALAGARTYTSRFPDEVDGWILRASAAHRTGNLEEAVRAYRRAWKLAPHDAEIGNSLGVLLLESGEGAASIDVFRRALEASPDSIPLLNNLGLALNRLRRFEEAETVLRQAVATDPNYPAAYNNLGHSLEELGRLEEAKENYRNALRKADRFPEAHKNLGNVLRRQGETGEALASYSRAVEEQPDYSGAWVSLGGLLAELGRREEAEEATRRALELRPDDTEAWSNLAVVKRFTSGDEDLRRIETLLEQPGHSVRDQAILHFIAGRAHDAIGDDPERAFTHFARSARLERSRIDYDVRRDESMFGKIRAAFADPEGSDSRAAGESRTAPVFVVGMPRSGTTLVEQILASHSGVRALGECLDLDAIVAATDARLGSPFPEWVPSLDSDTLATLGRDYRSRVLDPVRDAVRVVDKMPNNFRYLGLIARILPDARIIHVQRDPLDTCWSCFSHLFRGEQPFSYDLAELGRYYRAYHDLMEHWRRILPSSFLIEIRYEDLIDEPEQKIAELLGHCDLDWEAACMDFHRTERAVHTASFMQVREPLYRRAMGRWKRYRDHLDPLIEALGPLVDRNA